MAAEPGSGSDVRDLESLRIHRAALPKRSRLATPAIAATIFVTLAIGGYAVFSRTLGKPIEVQTAYLIVRQSGQPGVLLTGTGYVVTRHKYIVVGTKILGQIVAEPIEEGQLIRKGNLLARIDDRDYEAQLKQAIADRDLAEADVKLKKAQANRARLLYRSAAESADQLDVAENALAVARANLKKAEGEVDYARFNVSQCVITSPIDGIVLTKYRELGDTINYGGDIQAGGGTTDIVQLADTTDMRAEVDINEVDIAKVTMRLPATVTPDAYPDKSFDASVVKIYPQADRQKGTVKVEVKIVRPDLNIIKPEMSAKVIFMASPTSTSQAPLVLVPKKAIVTEGAKSYAWTVQGGVAAREQINTGREYQDGVEVKQGLPDGATLIVNPPSNLKDGQSVTVASS